jgi:hypothetical protein
MSFLTSKILHIPAQGSSQGILACRPSTRESIEIITKQLG